MIQRINSALLKNKIPHSIILNNSYEWFGRFWNVEKKQKSKRSLLPFNPQEKAKKARLDNRTKKVQKKAKKRKLKTIHEPIAHHTITVQPYEPSTKDREFHPIEDHAAKQSIPWPHKKDRAF